jgi:hypothetical protein
MSVCLSVCLSVRPCDSYSACNKSARNGRIFIKFDIWRFAKLCWGTLLVMQLVEAPRYKLEDRGFDSRWCHWNFSMTQSFRPHYGPEVDSASNRNEYQECFRFVKTAGGWGWQPYHLYVPIVLKSGSINLLQPSGPVQACNGIALLFTKLCSENLSLIKIWLN